MRRPVIQELRYPIDSSPSLPYEIARGQTMKSRDLKNSRARTGVSRLWLGVAAVVGAAVAYLGDRERGNARRQAALRQLTLVSSRLRGRALDQPPAQIAIPTEPARTKKPEL